MVPVTSVGKRRVRRVALTAHVTTSLGWLGAVVVFLALATICLTSRDPPTARAALLVMAPLAWGVLVPFAVASLLTGIVQAIGTDWGLFRHYWILFKLLITVIATVLLLNYLPTFRILAEAAADPASTGDELRALAGSPMLHAVLALLALLVATVLAVFKPAGRTGYGQRNQSRQRAARR